MLWHVFPETAPYFVAMVFRVFYYAYSLTVAARLRLARTYAFCGYVLAGLMTMVGATLPAGATETVQTLKGVNGAAAAKVTKIPTLVNATKNGIVFKNHVDMHEGYQSAHEKLTSLKANYNDEPPALGPELSTQLAEFRGGAVYDSAQGLAAQGAKFNRERAKQSLEPLEGSARAQPWRASAVSPTCTTALARARYPLQRTADGPCTCLPRAPGAGRGRGGAG